MSKTVSGIMLTLLLVSMLTLAFSTQPAVSEGGLVGYWKFDEGSGTAAIDSSGNGNTGTLNNGPTWVDGKSWKALSLDGIDDYVEVEDSNSLHFSTSVTLMAWVFLPLDATYVDGRVVGKDAGNGGTNLHLVIHDNLGHVGFGLGIGDGYTSVFQTSTEVVPRETWTHIAATYNGSLMRIYINGSLDSSLSWTSGFSSNINPLTIGSKNPPYLGFFFNGTIDEVRIYDRALSQQEIQSDMDTRTSTDYSDDFGTDTGLWTYVGTAYRDNVSEYVVLTEAVNDKAGAIWLNKSLSSSFTVRFRYWVGNSTGTTTDGFVVMFYKQRNFTLPTGGYLGFWGSGYGVEFDTSHNDWDPPDDHVALIENSTSNHLAYVYDARLSDNAWHNVTITVTMLSVVVYIDAGKILEWNGSLVTKYDGFGFSAGTGAAWPGGWNEWHIIDDFSISVRFDVAISDEFSGTVLNPAWIWVDPIGDCNYSLTSNPGHLRIFVPGDGHDLHPVANYDAPRVIQSVAGDFVVETRVLFDPQHDAQGAGILIWKDSDNYLRLDRLYHGGGQVVDVSGKKAGSWSQFAQISYLLTETYLRFERTADTFTAKYSEDGINWTTLNNISFAFFDPVCIGLFVIDQWQNNPIYADFDYFRVGIGSQTNRLTVYVMNSSSLPVHNASVNAANLTTYTNTSGYASFDLPFGTYNVTALHPDYQSASWIVDLDRDKNITLTLSYPYVFEGEIADSNIILTPVQSGYNITLLNNLTSSDMDVFFDWRYMGTIPAGTWQVFNFDHLPNLVVEAASKGSVDYPKAWYKHPLPIQLAPTTGDEGALPAEPTPYVAGSIFVIPYPPVYGQNTTIGVALHNPYNYTLNISRVDFQISGLTVGGYFTSVGYLSDISLQANETRICSIKWNATASGHHCIRVVLTYSPTTQAIQRNIDVENDVIQGGEGEVSFSLVNPFEMQQAMTIKVKKQLSAGSAVTLEINGHMYDTSSDIVIDAAPGQEFHATLRIDTSSSALEDGVVDVEAYADGQLIGGVRKTIKTIPPNPQISVNNPHGGSWGVEGNYITITGTGWRSGSRVHVTILTIGFSKDLGDINVDGEGKFSGMFQVPYVGDVPRKAFILATSDNQQSAQQDFYYFGGQSFIEDDILGILGLDSVTKFVNGKLTAKDLDIAIADHFTFGYVGRLDKIVSLTFETDNHHYLDLLAETSNGTLGTTRQGEYINTVNGSWASGNNFNDSQLILIPSVTSFNITVDATRAVQEIEFYNMAVRFSSAIANKTTSVYLQGEIQRGTCATYHASLTNWTISVEPLHSIRVASVTSKSVVGQGYSIPINVSIANDGYYAETFNVTAYANQTLIETKAITLTSGNSTTITFTWNTAGFAKGNYTISAYAWPVQGETDTTNNRFEYGTIVVTIPGDVDGNFEVDIYDITAICICYDSKIGPPRDPLYYPNCDLDGNGIIDIFDVTTACITYGQKYP